MDFVLRSPIVISEHTAQEESSIMFTERNLTLDPDRFDGGRDIVSSSSHQKTCSGGSAFEKIIGSGQGLSGVLDQVRMVAATDCTVLIQGETGTGKEVIAQAIHGASARRQQRFVAVNCAALPTALLESELFGHDRGAFTGAVTQRVGRFQAADRGTLFLDEIGDLPMELQPKLLRAIQEQQFERLGSSHTTRVDVRIVAATNQNLSEMVAERRFRMDLYYRLNVFPITLPPLRERPGDIRLLLAHFLRTFTQRQGKLIEYVPDEVVSAIEKHNWPGNIRELQNFIERAVILTRGAELRAPIAELTKSELQGDDVRTLDDANRAHIKATLRETNWVVGGLNGAAARLGMHRTTLISRMRKLGISRAAVEPSVGQSDSDIEIAERQLSVVA
jgi:formate hydrogenlyase transcriptional activator